MYVRTYVHSKNTSNWINLNGAHQFEPMVTELNAWKMEALYGPYGLYCF